MAHYVSEGGAGDFQPMNANFGVVSPLEKKVRGGKRMRNEALSRRSLEETDRLAGMIRTLAGEE